MRCIFCGNPSDTSRSREHILPEVLGNEMHVLPPGVVCDRCNNYFAVKIEGPLLDCTRFTNLRARQRIPNKRGRQPFTRAVFPLARMGVLLQDTPEGMAIMAARESDNAAFVQTLLSRPGGRIWIPQDGPVDSSLMSRFLAKVGIEMLAARYLSANEPLEGLVEMPALRPIRRYARRGVTPPEWPFHCRRIYPEDTCFEPDDAQVAHEFDFLWTGEGEVFAVVCIFGEEFAINMGEPSIEGYLSFLAQEGGRSSLYAPGELERSLRASGPHRQR